ncbi:hypothetical protein KUM39_16555 [Streptomyces sp. J2-1]|uniref:hypothetical protein n=1 Tax=Streptomyces corallincola TaxID=2851888 RepID=UPI001C385E5A|nr:hypothetical protein [Streptomyces corallincola]MBV2355967.1 hypothetical protein [Streptomyces corallincola]
MTVRPLAHCGRWASTIGCTLDPGLLERLTVRRAELDELQEQLADVRAERDGLAFAAAAP